jgi:hypothetical protein
MPLVEGSRKISFSENLTASFATEFRTINIEANPNKKDLLLILNELLIIMGIIEIK